MMRFSDETKITLLLIVIAIAGLLCATAVRSEPHGDMPPGWSLGEAPAAPIGATLVQDDDDDPAQRDLGSALLRLIRILADRTIAADYAGADRALALQKRAQEAWANEVFRPL